MYEKIDNYMSEVVIRDLEKQLQAKDNLTLYEMWLVKELRLSEFYHLVNEEIELFRPKDIEDRYNDIYAHIDNENYKQAYMELPMLPVTDPETVQIEHILHFMCNDED